MPEYDENDGSNDNVLDELSITNTSLVSSISLPSPAFSATGSSRDKGKTPVYRSNTNSNTNTNKLNSSADSNTTGNNINRTLQTTSNTKDDDTMNKSGPTAANYIWHYVRKQKMPDGQERVFCKRPQCKSHSGWIAQRGDTGNIRRYL